MAPRRPRFVFAVLALLAAGCNRSVAAPAAPGASLQPERRNRAARKPPIAIEIHILEYGPDG